MTNNLAKHKALKTLRQNRLYSLTDYNDLRRIIESNQFTIIEYKKHSNSEYISELIKKLGIENEIEQNDSFLYITNKLKFLFINSDVPDEDKCSLLCHELGHICDPDFMNNDINYSKIKKEEFANEFSCCIKKPSIMYKFYIFIIKRWKWLVGVTALAACVLGLSFMINPLLIASPEAVPSSISTTGTSDNTYYVTSSGKKYHRKSCITVRYKTNLTEYKLNEADDAGYSPCLICIYKE